MEVNINQGVNKQRIVSLASLKVIALFSLFWWHSALPNPGVDLGARACEFFFVVSGFLVAYNYSSNTIDPTWKQSFLYVRKKLSAMWPLHLVMFFVSLGLMPISEIVDKKTIFEALMNLTLLQSWSPNTYTFFAFNGTSWFLSTILFCYFISPFLLLSVSNTKRASISFIVALGMRLLIEVQQILYGSDITAWNLHVSPVVRGLEFYAGMALYPLSLNIRNKFSTSTRYTFGIASILEILMMMICMYLLVHYSGIWIRGQYVCMFCALIYLYSFDLGIVSKVLSTSLFNIFGGIEFEFFIMHQVIIRLVDTLSHSFHLSGIIRSMIALVVVLLCCYIWKRYCAKTTKQWMESFWGKLEEVY